jgi:DNA-binding SARP family transcriptional activator/tetratricopeptide (TPR) repeat protein
VTLVVRFLGRAEVGVDDRPLAIESRPALSLLGCLALQEGRPVRRDKLAGMLWPDSDETSARTNLRQALWRLRQGLADAGLDPDAVLDTSRTAIGLALDQVWVDCIEFERPLPATASDQALIEKVALYQGELLPGFYDEWVSTHRTRLSAAYDRRVSHLLDRLVRDREWDWAIEWATRWMAVAGPAEEAFRTLILAHSARGDSAAAVAAYQDCEDVLRKDLGVPPSEETRALYERLLKGERLVEILPDAVEAPSSEALDTEIEAMLPLPDRALYFPVGEELAWLDHLWADAVSGRGRVALVSGDAGRGKTALVMDFIEACEREDPSVLAVSGSCEAQLGVGDPYAPFRAILASLTGDLRARPGRALMSRATAERLLRSRTTVWTAIQRDGPDLPLVFLRAPTGDAISATRSPVSAPSRLVQNDIFDQVVRVLLRVSESKPLIVFVDDLQWADPGSLGLFYQLGRHVDDARILLVGAFRPEELASPPRHPLHKIMAELGRQQGDFRLDLDARRPVEGRAFVNALIDSEPNALDVAFRDSLFDRTGGHPLFTIELLRSMQAEGSLSKDERGRWAVSETLDWHRLPAKVEAALDGRLARLPRPLYDVLQAAAADGDWFMAETVAAASRRPTADVLADLSGPLSDEHRLVAGDGVERFGDEILSIYRFRHQLIQSYIYERIDPVLRIHLHRIIADTLSRYRRVPRAEIIGRLAHHYEEAGDLEHAVDALLELGNRARRLSASDEAIRHLRHGLALLAGLPSGPKSDVTEAALQLALGLALIAGRGYAAPDVERAFARARRLSQRTPRTREDRLARWGLWSFYTVRARHKTAASLARELLSVESLNPDPVQKPGAESALGTSLFYLTDVDQATRQFQACLADSRPSDYLVQAEIFGQIPAVEAHAYLGLAYWMQGKGERSRTSMDESVELAREAGHPFSQAFALTLRATAHYLRREPEEALRFGDEGIEVAEKYGFPFWSAGGRVFSGWGQFMLGQREEGMARVQAGIEMWEGLGAELARPTYRGVLAELQAALGQTEASAATLENAIDMAERRAERISLPDLRRMQSELYLQQGDSQLASETLEQAMLASKGLPRLALRVALDKARLKQSLGDEKTWRRQLKACLQAVPGSASEAEHGEAEKLLGGAAPAPL